MTSTIQFLASMEDLLSPRNIQTSLITGKLPALLPTPAKKHSVLASSDPQMWSSGRA